jgi:tRNA threonylcarbamoyladenosine biosynthesis protein TsaE
MSKEPKQSHIVRSLEETDRLAAELVADLSAQKGAATVLLFRGDLGAGKTTFTKGIAKALGIKDSVISPTFILEKKYKIKNNAQFTSLIHIDAYRFEDETEAGVLQLEQELIDDKTIVVIEWPEKLGRHVPQNAQTVLFRGLDETTKEIIW